MYSSRGTSPSTSVSPAPELDELRKHTEYLKRALRRKQRRQEEHQQQQARHDALETKRLQWKAASARYYEKHPEVREKKRLKMARQRAEKKASRRRRDPPKTLSVPHSPTAFIAEADGAQAGRERLQSREAVAVVSLLFLQQRTKPNPFPEDLPPSSDPGTSDDDEPSRTSSGKRRRPAGRLA